MKKTIYNLWLHEMREPSLAQAVLRTREQQAVQHCCLLWKDRLVQLVSVESCQIVWAKGWHYARLQRSSKRLVLLYKLHLLQQRNYACRLCLGGVSSRTLSNDVWCCHVSSYRPTTRTCQGASDQRGRRPCLCKETIKSCWKLLELQRVRNFLIFRRNDLLANVYKHRLYFQITTNLTLSLICA